MTGRLQLEKIGVGIAALVLGVSAMFALFSTSTARANLPENPEVLRGHTAQVTSVAFSPDGHSLASSADDHTIHLWELATGKTIRILPANEEVYSVAYSPDGRFIASSGFEPRVSVWDAGSGQLVRAFEGLKSWSISIAFSPDGRSLVAGDQDGAILFWDVTSGQLLRTLKQEALVTCLALSPDGRMMATATLDIYIWNLQTGQIVQTLKGHENLVSSVAFSPDGNFLISGSWDRSARIWSLASGESLHTLEASGKVTFATGNGERSGEMKLPVDAVTFSPDGKLVATAGADHWTRLWNAESGKLVRSFEGPQEAVSDVQFSPDGALVAASSLDRTIWLWSVN
jgi:WD40 repeat protein